MGLPKTRTQNDAIWVIIDRFTKIDTSMNSNSSLRLARFYIQEVMRLSGALVSIVSD